MQTSSQCSRIILAFYWGTAPRSSITAVVMKFPGYPLPSLNDKYLLVATYISRDQSSLLWRGSHCASLGLLKRSTYIFCSWPCHICSCHASLLALHAAPAYRIFLKNLWVWSLVIWSVNDLLSLLPHCSKLHPQKISVNFASMRRSDDLR